MSKPTEPATIVTKPWDDYDARRDPKTNHYCARCQKDLKPGQPVRWVHLIGGGGKLLHPSSEAAYAPDAGELGFHPVGIDCARKLGLEWSILAPDLDAGVIRYTPRHPVRRRLPEACA